MARPMPVFPDVPSTIVPPGLRSPARSASSIIFTAMRSLIELPGLNVSIFARTVPLTTPLVMRLMRTIGVSPMASRMVGLIGFTNRVYTFGRPDSGLGTRDSGFGIRDSGLVGSHCHAASQPVPSHESLEPRIPNPESRIPDTYAETDCRAGRRRRRGHEAEENRR